jgi:hypothetical protein
VPSPRHEAKLEAKEEEVGPKLKSYLKQKEKRETVMLDLNTLTKLQDKQIGLRSESQVIEEESSG